MISKKKDSEGNGLEQPKDHDGVKRLFLGSTRAPRLGEIIPQRMPGHVESGPRRCFLTKSTKQLGRLKRWW